MVLQTLFVCLFVCVPAGWLVFFGVVWCGVADVGGCGWGACGANVVGCIWVVGCVFAWLTVGIALARGEGAGGADVSNTDATDVGEEKVARYCEEGAT